MAADGLPEAEAPAAHLRRVVPQRRRILRLGDRALGVERDAAQSLRVHLEGHVEVLDRQAGGVDVDPVEDVGAVQAREARHDRDRIRSARRLTELVQVLRADVRAFAVRGQEPPRARRGGVGRGRRAPGDRRDPVVGEERQARAQIIRPGARVGIQQEQKGEALGDAEVLQPRADRPGLAAVGHEIERTGARDTRAGDRVVGRAVGDDEDVVRGDEATGRGHGLRNDQTLVVGGDEHRNVVGAVEHRRLQETVSGALLGDQPHHGDETPDERRHPHGGDGDEDDEARCHDGFLLRGRGVPRTLRASAPSRTAAEPHTGLRFSARTVAVGGIPHDPVRELDRPAGSHQCERRISAGTRSDAPPAALETSEGRASPTALSDPAVGG